eukprot:1143774-Pelagomonas_calceolata.AAC.11
MAGHSERAYLGSGVVAPHSDTADTGVELASLHGQLGLGAVLIQAGQGMEVPVTARCRKRECKHNGHVEYRTLHCS